MIFISSIMEILKQVIIHAYNIISIIKIEIHVNT